MICQRKAAVVRLKKQTEIRFVGQSHSVKTAALSTSFINDLLSQITWAWFSVAKTL